MAPVASRRLAAAIPSAWRSACSSSSYSAAAARTANMKRPSFVLRGVEAPAVVGAPGEEEQGHSREVEEPGRARQPQNHARVPALCPIIVHEHWHQQAEANIERRVRYENQRHDGLYSRGPASPPRQGRHGQRDHTGRSVGPHVRRTNIADRRRRGAPGQGQRHPRPGPPHPPTGTPVLRRPYIGSGQSDNGLPRWRVCTLPRLLFRTVMPRGSF